MPLESFLSFNLKKTLFSLKTGGFSPFRPKMAKIPHFRPKRPPRHPQKVLVLTGGNFYRIRGILRVCHMAHLYGPYPPQRRVLEPYRWGLFGPCLPCLQPSHRRLNPFFFPEKEKKSPSFLEVHLFGLTM